MLKRDSVHDVRGDLTVFTRVLGDDYRNEDIQVGIKDSGVGIKKELVHKIFDPFFTTKQEGTGLGLAIVNKIIEAHNGKIFVESVEGSGTTFPLICRKIIFTIPILLAICILKMKH